VLIQISFVAEYVQFWFQPTGSTPVPAHRGPLTCERMPILTLPSGETRAPGEPGYADGLVGLIYATVQAVDEYLDLGLTVSLDTGARLAVSLRPGDDEWWEVATFTTAHYVSVWVAGEPPFDQR
jgi:hypothetical protein